MIACRKIEFILKFIYKSNSKLSLSRDPNRTWLSSGKQLGFGFAIHIVLTSFSSNSSMIRDHKTKFHSILSDDWSNHRSKISFVKYTLNYCQHCLIYFKTRILSNNKLNFRYDVISTYTLALKIPQHQFFSTCILFDI